MIDGCPICGSLSLNEQPQASLHAYTTVYECGTEITKAFNSDDEGIFDKKCKKLSIEEFYNNLTYDNVKIALDTKDEFRFLINGNSVRIHYKDGGFTTFFKQDLYRRYVYNKGLKYGE